MGAKPFGIPKREVWEAFKRMKANQGAAGVDRGVRVRRHLEPGLERVLHSDSYGDRPGRSAIDAIRVARQRCWRAALVLDLDTKGFFGSIDHGLLLKALRKHTQTPWALLHVERCQRSGPIQGRSSSLHSETIHTPDLIYLYHS